MAHNVTDASLVGIQEKLSGIPTEHPLDANTFSDWSMQAGDVVTLKRGAEEYSSTVHNMKMVWTGAPKTTISNTGNKERPAVASVSRKKYGRGGTAVRTQEHIYKEFHSEDGYLHSYVEMTESYLRTEFDDDMNSLRGEFEMTASHLRTEFEDDINSLRGDFEVTASHLRTEFEDGINSLHGEFEVTASNLRTEFTDEVNSLHGELVVTAQSLRTDFTDEVNSLHGELVVTAASLRSDFTDEVNSLHGELVQTASELRSEYTDEINSVSSRISQTADKVSIVVDGNNHIKAAEIAASINAQTGVSTVKLSADIVDIDGDTIVDYLNGLDIDVDNVDASVVNAREIYLDETDLQDTVLAFTDVSASTVGDEVTLTFTQVNGEEKTVTFRKATSINGLTGSWSGRKLTVATNPSTGHEYTIGFNGVYDQNLEVSRNIDEDITISGNTVNVPVKIDTVMSSAPYTHTTRYTTSINVPVPLEARTGTAKITSNGTFIPSTDYIGFSSVEVDVSGSAVISGMAGTWSNNNVLTVKTNPDTGYQYTVGFNGAYNANLNVFPNGDATAASSSGTVNVPVKVCTVGTSSPYTQITRYTTTINTSIPLETLNATSNGTYSPASGKVGFSSVEVNVPSYADGWIAAYGKVSWPGSGTSATMTMQAPAAYGNTPDYQQVNYTVSADNSYAYIKAGTITVARVSNPAYANGWTAAYNKVTLPTAAQTSSASMTVSTPNSTSSASPNPINTVYTVSADNSCAYIKTASGTIVAQATHSAYANGWTGAYNKVTLPAAGTSASMVVKTPNSSSSATPNPVSTTYTVSVDNTYAYIKTGSTTVARVSNTAYANGWTNCYNGVQLDSTTATTLSYGQSITVYAQAYSTKDATARTNKQSRTITAPADRYNTGYTAGWGACYGTLDSTGTTASGTLGYGAQASVMIKQKDSSGNIQTRVTRTYTAPADRTITASAGNWISDGENASHKVVTVYRDGASYTSVSVNSGGVSVGYLDAYSPSPKRYSITSGAGTASCATQMGFRISFAGTYRDIIVNAPTNNAYRDGFAAGGGGGGGSVTPSVKKLTVESKNTTPTYPSASLISGLSDVGSGKRVTISVYGTGVKTKYWYITT